MIVTAGLLIAAIGLGLIFRELHKAPEGYQDEKGFHATAKPQPDTGQRSTAIRAGQHPHTPPRPATAH